MFGKNIYGTINGIKISDNWCEFINSISYFLLRDVTRVSVNTSDVAMQYSESHDIGIQELYMKSVEFLRDLDTKGFNTSDLDDNLETYLADTANIFKIQTLVKSVAVLCKEALMNPEYEESIYVCWYDLLSLITFDLFKYATKIKDAGNEVYIELETSKSKHDNLTYAIVGIVCSLMSMKLKYCDKEKFNDTDNFICNKSYLINVGKDYIKSNKAIDEFVKPSGWSDGAMNEPLSFDVDSCKAVEGVCSGILKDYFGTDKLTLDLD